MPTVQIYKSTDASAPTLNGTVGSLVALLDACLVNGYGSKAAAGWTKPYTATGQAVFRNSAVDGTGYYLNVNDNGPGTGTFREARMTGFTSMSAVGTGSGQFPTLAQLGIGIGAVVCRKSTTADSTARAWTLLADTTVFYLITETGDNVSPFGAFFFGFGDFYSYKANDTGRCMIIGQNNENTADPRAQHFPLLCGNPNTTQGGHYLAQSLAAAGGSAGWGKITDSVKMGGTTSFASVTGTTQAANQTFNIMGANTNGTHMNFPNGADNSVWMAPLWVCERNNVRGYLKGLWCPLQYLPFGHGDTFNGSGALAAKSFLALILTCSSSQNFTQSEVFLETSSTWG